MINKIALIVACLLVVSSAQVTPVPAKHEVSHDYKPHANAYYKIGAPYKKHGVRYVPKFEPHYVKTGVASWYGPGFHGRKTANGDIFDAHSFTAAHPTLPLFSRVWVTNIETGKKILVTVNDRGPYANHRIIDLSNAAAEALGYIHKGTAKVKVEYDAAETENYLKQIGLIEQYRKKLKIKM